MASSQVQSMAKFAQKTTVKPNLPGAAKRINRALNNTKSSSGTVAKIVAPKVVGGATNGIGAAPSAGYGAKNPLRPADKTGGKMTIQPVPAAKPAPGGPTPVGQAAKPIAMPTGGDYAPPPKTPKQLFKVGGRVYYSNGQGGYSHIANPTKQQIASAANGKAPKGFDNSWLIAYPKAPTAATPGAGAGTPAAGGSTPQVAGASWDDFLKGVLGNLATQSDAASVQFKNQLIPQLQALYNAQVSGGTPAPTPLQNLDFYTGLNTATRDTFNGLSDTYGKMASLNAVSPLTGMTPYGAAMQQAQRGYVNDVSSNAQALAARGWTGSSGYMDNALGASAGAKTLAETNALNEYGANALTGLNMNVESSLGNLNQWISNALVSAYGQQQQSLGG